MTQQKCLTLSRANTAQDRSNALYESALKARTPLLLRALYFLYVVVGLTALIAFAWFEPVSNWLFAWLLTQGAPSWLIAYIGVPIVMVLRAILMVESFGYAYHRFFQHVGFFTRKSQVVRRNQKFHWIHHMVIYPIGRF